MSRLLRRLIDPSSLENLSFPRNPAELAQILSHHYMVPFDNVDMLQSQQSDALCRGCTGDGISKRQLYTDDDDIIYSFRRCIILNGINAAATKADLLDRSILIGLDRIANNERRDEERLETEFSQARPHILGGMLDALSKAISIKTNTRLDSKPRLADFANWGCAIAAGLGSSPECFMAAYMANIDEQNDEVVYGHPVAAAIMALMDKEGHWDGQAAALLDELEAEAAIQKIDVRDKMWPKSPSALGRRLNEVRTNLQDAGILISKCKSGSRNITISKEQKNTAQTDHLSVEDVKSEYLAWGNSQGGRNGLPWSPTHAANRRRHLGWWQDNLGILTLGEMPGILPRVEKALRELQRLGRAGKTIANYAEALGAFCDWCVKRGYLGHDPLAAMAPFDTTPLTQRRAMTVDEINRLLDVAPTYRRILYETAFLSGLRANELCNLTVDHLDVKRRGLHLDAAWTKNRKGGFHSIPALLVDRLSEFAKTGEAKQLYDRRYGRKDAHQETPDNPLLYVPTHTARDLDKDLEAADIPKYAPGGKLDFHACRLAYINLVLERGDVTVKEAQARHATPELTMNVYGRTREERLTEAVDKVAEHLRIGENYVHSMYRQAVGAEQENATPIETESCVSSQLVEAAGIEPASENDPTQISYVRSQSTISSPVVPTDRILKELVQ